MWINSTFNSSILLLHLTQALVGFRIEMEIIKVEKNVSNFEDVGTTGEALLAPQLMAVPIWDRRRSLYLNYSFGQSFRNFTAVMRSSQAYSTEVVRPSVAIELVVSPRLLQLKFLSLQCDSIRRMKFHVRVLKHKGSILYEIDQYLTKSHPSTSFVCIDKGLIS